MSMSTKLLFILGASALALGLPLCLISVYGSVIAMQKQDPIVRLAELEIDPVQLEAYKAALKEEIETSIRVEPGVLTLYAVAEKENPARIRVFEMYSDEAAYMVKELHDTAGAGQDAELFNFATDVDSGQRAEIRIMQNMLEKTPSKEKR